MRCAFARLWWSVMAPVYFVVNRMICARIPRIEPTATQTAPPQAASRALPRSGGGNYDAIVVGGGHNGLTTTAYLARAGLRVCVPRSAGGPRRGVRHGGAVARSAGVARLVRGLDAPAEGRRRPAAGGFRLPGDPARSGVRLAHRTGPDLLLQRDRAHGGVDRPLLAQGCRGLPRLRGSVHTRGAIRQADDAPRAAGARLEAAGGPRRAAARGGADGGIQQARDPRARPDVHDVRRRPPGRPLRARRAQGLDGIERRRGRVGRAAHSRHRVQPPAPRARRMRGHRGRMGPGRGRHGRHQPGDRQVGRERGSGDPYREPGRLDRRARRRRDRGDADGWNGAAGSRGRRRHPSRRPPCSTSSAPSTSRPRSPTTCAAIGRAADRSRSTCCCRSRRATRA